jgi:putative DNA primase/helicase
MSKAASDGFRESADSGLEGEAVNHEAASILPAIDGSAEANSNEGAAESDPFAGSAEDHAANETRRKIELFEWADSVLGLNETELELALDDAVKRFGMQRRALKRIIAAGRSEKLKAKAKEERSRTEPRDNENNVKYYSPDFKVSDRGVYARKFDDQGHPFWDRICTTRIDLLALTRDRREENWGTYIIITNRDGGRKKLAIPHALTAADKVADIASLLASLGVGVVPSKQARQLLVQFLTLEVPERITAVPQIGWHFSGDAWLFVLPDETIVPGGFVGSQPVLQTASLHVQHGLDVSGTVEQWIDQVAAPLAGNSNVHLCVGTAFAGPLLKWAGEPPGIFHLWGTSKIAKSLVGAIGQSVWGRPKVPGEPDAFGASWTATAVGLERYAVLRSDVGAYFDEIGEGAPKVIRPAVYVLANGSSKLRGTPEIHLRPMESFRILGISTGEPTIEAYLSSGGEKVPAGLKVRLVDVPAEVRPESAFETCSADGIEELGKQFYPLTLQLHGATGRAWLQHLVDIGSEEITVRLRRHREEWLSLPAVAEVRKTATAQVRSILNRFALIAAALRMVIEANLLPWSIEDTDLGIATCMMRWLKSRKGRLDVTGEMLGAIEQIRTILAADLHGRFIHQRLIDGNLDYANPADATKRDTLGYVKNGRILVDPTAWRSVLCAGYDPEKTARHLKNEGLLIADDGKLQHQEKVKRGGDVVKARFYVLDPKILDDAAGTGPKEASL